MGDPVTVWVIDDDKSIRWVLEKAFKKEGMQVRCFSNGSDLLEALQHEQPEVMLTDIRMPGMDGITLLQRVGDQYPDLPVIVMTAHSDLDSAVSSYDAGAFEYLPKPFDVDEAIGQVKRASAHRAQIRQVEQGSAGGQGSETTEIIGEAPAMQEVFRAIGRLSRSQITVLINGESGTGKELVARALHKHSPRAAQPFIALNMAAIPKDLLESELFGHEKGAFTGAQSKRVGRFEQAKGGSLFLDEIGDMPAEMQTRLLRVLSDGEFYPVGGREPVRADVRIIAATHQSLELLVEEGRFREDLFHRLNVIRVHIPPLRDRRQDIRILLKYFLSTAANEIGVDQKTLLPEVERFLTELNWPGNVRQLENACRWLTVMGAGQEIHLDDLPPELRDEGQKKQLMEGSSWQEEVRLATDQWLAKGDTNLAKRIVPTVEKIIIEQALQHTSGRKQDAARLLGYGRNTLTRKIKELGITDS